MTLQNEYDNYLLWGVTSKEEVDAITERFNGYMVKIEKRENLFHRPRSEWTEEMLEQEKDFKMLTKIIELVKITPNDQELGEKIRMLVNTK